ncbi:E3 ubiquitin-protein ligase TRIM31-like [Nannospalax galili]|uniref:E3 ubiquitin-protein ligase TRIM31-like n=1 Tax=Nannospalax galili TaxID=1026970 RepID=UPI0004ED660D|nr:E3 ubiquitin-protein ligase TRIM31-like [Nannospalax galili]
MAGRLQEEVTCPICSDILKEPVTIDCGHNFCSLCISRVEGRADIFQCPLCKASVRRRTFNTNWLLVSLVEKIQAMDATPPEEAEPRCQRHRKKSPVTLDPASAHPDLILSQDLKTVTLYLVSRGDSEEPEDQQRFYPFQCVLGSPGLSAGSRAWEVELEGPEVKAGKREGTCEVGVASELAPRRGCLQVMPLSGFWALRITGSGCQPLTDSFPRETLQVCPRKVGVYVDHDFGEVVFFDAATNNHIYTFRASFSGQVFPFIRILVPGTQITLSP